MIRCVVSACCVGVLLYADAHAEDANQQASADATEMLKIQNKQRVEQENSPDNK